MRLGVITAFTSKLNGRSTAPLARPRVLPDGTGASMASQNWLNIQLSPRLQGRGSCAFNSQVLCVNLTGEPQLPSYSPTHDVASHDHSIHGQAWKHTGGDFEESQKRCWTLTCRVSVEPNTLST